MMDTIPPHLIHDDSLLGCLVALTEHFGHPHSAQALSSGLPLKDNRLTLKLFPRAAARANCSARLLRTALSDVQPALLPAILLLHGEKACLLLEIRENSYVVQYPEVDSPIEVPAADLRARHTGLIYFVKPLFRFEPRSRGGVSESSRHWFWAAMLRNRGLYRDAMVASVLVNMFALAMPLFTLNVYDRVLPNNAVETLWVLVAGIVLVVFFNLLLSTARAYVLDTASKKVDVRLSAQIMERVLDIRMESRPPSVGSFAANLRSFETVRDFIASASLAAVVDLPFVLLFLGVLAWISPLMLIPPLVAIVVVLVVSFVAQARIGALVAESFQATAQRNANLIESLSGLDTVKALNAQSEMQRRWESSTEFLARMNARIKHISSVTVGLVRTAQQLVTISVVVIGAYLVQDAAISLGGIIAASMIAGRCLAPLGQVAGLLMQYQNARASLGAIDNCMKAPVERPAERHFVPRPFLKGEVELRNVSFSYPGAAQPALNRVNLHIRAGEKVGILGRIGSGKSTLEKLILGLYQPSSGAVLVDGIDIQQIDPADLRRSIGYVSQDPVLFYGTLKQNLTMGAPFVDDRHMLDAARIAGIEEFAARQPDGYDMMIGERGESLSGGQRQSIAIGRALINDPPILLLDEPSSNMDNQSESLLRRRLQRVVAGKTLILVTHRTSLLALVDRLIVIDGGRIVADGPKEQVVEALREGRIGKAVEAA
ncbi:type I secretion system permease/ATPase [Alcaligenaceae bacterium]|nr:type I secretion system permease/ATPase [Alcaligenaceae bacterium]